MKTIVTHQSLDLDSITACWLIKRFLCGWSRAKIRFVPAGSTLNNKPPDDDPEIIHVDTGLGRFDHHQTSAFTCSTKRVFKYLLEKKCVNPEDVKPLKRIVKFVNSIDHFQEVFFPDPLNDIYDFALHRVIGGMQAFLHDDIKLTEIGFTLLDGALEVFREKISAEDDLKKASVFTCRWGKALAVNSDNEEVIRMALKKGFSLAVRKNLQNGGVRIKSRPVKEIDLTPLYLKIKSIDKKGTWFLHASKHMLLNFSSKNSRFTPTQLNLKKLIKIVKSI